MGRICGMKIYKTFPVILSSMVSGDDVQELENMTGSFKLAVWENIGLSAIFDSYIYIYTHR